MLEALKPSMKALIEDSLLKHSDDDVKVSVASCISEITRITAPDAPYDDDQMRVHHKIPYSPLVKLPYNIIILLFIFSSAHYKLLRYMHRMYFN